MSSDTAPDLGVVRFGRRQSKGLLLGLSGPRVGCLATAVATLTVTMAAAGLPGMVIAAPVWVLPVAACFAPWNAQPAIEAAPTLLYWGLRWARQQTRYLVRVSAPRPAGTLALPGDLACLRLHVDPVSAAALIHDPHRGTLAAVLPVSHPAYVLLSPEEQASRVGSWGRVLAGLAGTGACVQVLESTLPDPGHGVRGWFAEQGVHDGSWAAREYAALLDQAAPSSATHRTLLAVSVPVPHTRGRGAADAVAGAVPVLRRMMRSFEESVRAAELRTEPWLQAAQLAVIVRQCYDPAADGMRPTDPGAELATAGPAAVQEYWDYLRHDAGFSAVLWISEWPRSDVAPHFLHSLVFEPGVRKTVSITAKPLATADALRSIRREKVDYLTEAQQQARVGRVADLAAEQEYVDVLARERALISGHADLRFSGFVAVTAGTRDALTTALAATERAAAQAGCETRLLVGQQAQAFGCAALPLARTVH